MQETPLRRPQLARVALRGPLVALTRLTQQLTREGKASSPRALTTQDRFRAAIPGKQEIGFHRLLGAQASVTRPVSRLLNITDRYKALWSHPQLCSRPPAIPSHPQPSPAGLEGSLSVPFSQTLEPVKTNLQFWPVSSLTSSTGPALHPVAIRYT